jgi:hypothetical protein
VNPGAARVRIAARDCLPQGHPDAATRPAKAQVHFGRAQKALRPLRQCGILRNEIRCNCTGPGQEDIEGVRILVGVVYIDRHAQPVEFGHGNGSADNIALTINDEMLDQTEIECRTVRIK